MCKGSHIGTEYKCPICGTSFVNSLKGKPRIYCSDNCRDLNKYLNAVEDKVLNVSFDNSFCSKQLKGQVWRIANLIKITK